MTLVTVILTIMGVLTFDSIGVGTALILGLIPVTIFSGLAIILHFNRISIYAVVFGMPTSANELLNIYDYNSYGGIALIYCGFIIIGMCIAILLKFLRQYSVLEGEEMYA